MKVVIFDSHGDSIFPYQLALLIQDIPFPENRTGKIIEILETIPKHDECDDLSSKLKQLKAGELLRRDNTFYFVNYGKRNCFSIVEVDINRKWTISEYDGAEYIEYLDNYILVSEEINYYYKR